MRKVLLVCGAAAVIAGCSSAPPTPTPSPLPTVPNTAPATYAEFLGQLFVKAGYGLVTRHVWEKNGATVTVTPDGEHRASVVVVFTRADGTVRCEPQTIKDAYVGAIDSLNELTTPQLAKQPECKPE